MRVELANLCYNRFMDTQPLPQPNPQPQPRYDPDEKMVRDFLWLIEQGCTFRVSRRFGMTVTLLIKRPGKYAEMGLIDLRNPKSFAELLSGVRRTYHVLP